MLGESALLFQVKINKKFQDDLIRALIVISNEIIFEVIMISRLRYPCGQVLKITSESLEILNKFSFLSQTLYLSLICISFEILNRIFHGLLKRPRRIRKL